MGRIVSLNLRCTIAMRRTATKPAGANAIVRYEICLIAIRIWMRQYDEMVWAIEAYLRCLS